MPADHPRWSPDRYLRYAAERELPFRHLMSAIEDLEPTTIADLGCGAGGPTLRLAARWPGAGIWGVDRSEEMLAAARSLPGTTGVTWVASDIRQWRAPVPLDLIVSNATFHWIPDHAALLDHLARQLAADGTLAFQVPDNFGEPSHRFLYALCEEAPWRHMLAGVPRPGVRPAGWYRDALAARGFTVTVWEATYHHLLAGEDPVLEWVRGSTLRPTIAALPEADAPEFLAEYGRRLRSAYSAGTGGTVYPFHRIFVVATRQAA